MEPEQATQQGASVHDRLMGLYADEETPSKPDPETPVEDVEATDQQVDESATVESETEVKEDEGEVQAEAPEDTKWMPNSVTELAEALEVDSKELLDRLKVQTKVDGEVGEATLADVVKTHQLEKHLTRRSEQLAQERKEAEEQIAAQRQEYEQKAQEAQDTLDAMEQMLAEDFQSVNWTELQQEDPTQYLITQQQMQQRFAGIQAKRSAIQEKRDADLKAQQEKDQEDFKRKAAEEKVMLSGSIPGWEDPKGFQDGMAELSKYLVEDVGFRSGEWGGVIDHRAYVIAHKAMKYDRLMADAKPKKQQLKAKPKFVPPGARKASQDADATRVAKLRERSKAGDKSATHELLMMKFKR